MRRLLLIGGILFLASAHGSSQPNEDGAHAAAQRRGCKPLAEPKELPGVDALFDSSALVAILPVGDTAGPTEDVLTIVTGSKPRIYVNDSAATRFDAAATDQVIKTLRSSSKSAAPAFRLRVTPGKPLGLTIERPQFCAPDTVGDPIVKTSVTTVQRAGTPRPQPRPVTPRIKIGVNGEVLDVVLGNGSGMPELDRALEQSIRSQQWRPALLDGHPIVVISTAGKIEIVR